jgi:hypothetical protein
VQLLVLFSAQLAFLLSFEEEGFREKDHIPNPTRQAGPKRSQTPMPNFENVRLELLATCLSELPKSEGGKGLSLGGKLAPGKVSERLSERLSGKFVP